MKGGIYNYIINNKTTSILNFIVLLILFVPFSYSYGNIYETEELHWIPNYIFEELELIIFYIPILLLTILFQIQKKCFWKKIILIIFLLISILSLLVIISSGIIPDYSLGLGGILIMSLTPLIMIIYKIEQFKKIREKSI